MYSTYEAPSFGEAECEADPSDRRKIVILGGGPKPDRAGDRVSIIAASTPALRWARNGTALRSRRSWSIGNPETVSTDYDTSDRLYFEPLTAEDVLEILRVEQQSGELVGVIVQFGGQTPLKLAQALEDAGDPHPRHLARRD